LETLRLELVDVKATNRWLLDRFAPTREAREALSDERLAEQYEATEERKRKSKQ
jgi:hypothetical protein